MQDSATAPPIFSDWNVQVQDLAGENARRVEQIRHLRQRLVDLYARNDVKRERVKTLRKILTAVEMAVNGVEKPSAVATIYNPAFAPLTIPIQTAASLLAFVVRLAEFKTTSLLRKYDARATDLVSTHELMYSQLETALADRIITEDEFVIVRDHYNRCLARNFQKISVTGDSLKEDASTQ